MRGMARPTTLLMAALCLSTAACTSQQTPAPPPTTAFSATSVPTAGPRGDNSDAAAVVAAEAYVWATQSGSDTQDAALISPMVDPDCACIRALTDAIDVQKKNNFHLTPSRLTPATAVITKRDGDHVQLELRYVSPAFEILDAHDKAVQSYAEENEVADVALRFDGSVWRVSSFEFVKRP